MVTGEQRARRAGDDPEVSVGPVFGPGQVVTVFRSRLRARAGDGADDGADEAPGYDVVAEEMLAAARAMPGFVDFKTFSAQDGERVSVVTFASRAAHDAWRDDVRHREAQRRGRDEFYEEYSIQVGECIRTRQWTTPS